MTIMAEVNRCFDRLTQAYQRCKGAFQNLEACLMPIDEQVSKAVPRFGLMDCCDRAATCIAEAREKPDRLSNCIDTLDSLVKRIQSAYAMLCTQMTVLYEGKSKRADIGALTAARCECAEAILNVKYIFEECCQVFQADLLGYGEKPEEMYPEDLAVLKNQTVLLRNTFTELQRNYIDTCWGKVQQICDELDQEFIREPAKAFIDNLKQSLGKLLSDCSKAHELLSKDCRPSKDLSETLHHYEELLRDMLIAYKGFYDLIRIEVSTQQLPPEFLDCLEPWLAKPFEVYNGLQKSLLALQDKIAKGSIGACLEDLAQQCEELGKFSQELIKDLNDCRGTQPPSAVDPLIRLLESAMKKVQNACQMIDGLASDPKAWADPVRVGKSLRQFEAMKEEARQECLQILNKLMETVQKQELSLAWPERAGFLECAKKGLKGFWERLTDLNRKVRDCLEEVDKEAEKETEKKGEPKDQAIRDIATGVETLASAGFPDGGMPGGVAPVAGLDFERRISVGIASVLGHDLKTPRTSKTELLAFAQQLKTVLNRTIVKTQRDGMTVYEVQRRGVVPTDTGVGQIRGTQATYYQQVNKIRDAAFELLNMLVCQLRDCDEEEIDFLKENIRTTVSDIVAEIGREGGALPKRVDVLFDTLREDLDALEDALGVGAPLGDQKEMDIAQREENQRNFRLLNESLIVGAFSLQNVSNQYRVEIVQARGTLLATLLRTVEAIADSVQGIYSLMDSVRLGAVDRRVTIVTGATTVEQLLSWIETSASTEWPARLGGGDTREIEVRAVHRTADGQINLIDIFIANLPNIIQTGANRVGGALRELRRELVEVRRLGRIIAP